MSIATLNDIFFAAVERNLDRIMIYRDAGKWLPITSREFGQSVARTARALRAWGDSVPATASQFSARTARSGRSPTSPACCWAP